MKKKIIINILLCALTVTLTSCSEKTESEKSIKPTEESITESAVTEEITTFLMTSTTITSEIETTSAAASVVEFDPHNIDRLSLGGSHTGFVKEDGSLYVWGCGFEYQLGNGEEGYEAISSVPIKIMDNVETVSLGNGHSGALTKEGELYMWGNNILYDVGDIETDNDNVIVPTKIDIMSNS